MRSVIFLTLTFITFAFSDLLFGQDLHVVYLNQNTVNYVSPLELTVGKGESVKFVTMSGDFDINIPNANNVFTVGSRTLHIKLDSKHPESIVYTTQNNEISQIYSVECTSGGGVPTAPPKIIIVTE